VAQLIQKWPLMTPDQVKALIVNTASKFPAPTDPQAQGAGILNMRAASAVKLPPIAVQVPIPGTGTGSLEASRGSSHLVLNGVTLSGEQDIFGQTFNSASMAAAEAAGHAWWGGDWNGRTWSGFTWSGNTWTGHTWSGNDWSGHAWSTDNWSNGTWDGFSWSGFTWSGSSWSGFTWSSELWANDSWS
jgi:serine protease AprX